jgi:TetR/AcrR family transcriptional repressor of nem operon
MSKAEQTKAFIVRKTASIFNKKGYAGTSLADLEQATGLTKGALYGNFKNKDEIALTVFDHNIQLVKEVFFGKRDPSKNPLEQLLAIPVSIKMNFPSLTAHGGCPILNTAIEADDNHPLLKKKVSKAIHAWKQNIESVIREGMATNVIKKNIDPAKYSTAFLALFEGSLMLTKITGDLSFLHEAMERLKTIILTELKK